MMNSLSARIYSVNELKDRDRRAMYEIYARYYDATAYEVFCEDLSKKHFVVAIYDDIPISKLQGFSTVSVEVYRFRGKEVRVLFSGDTIVEREYWGQQVLALEWCRLAGRIKAEVPDQPLYWLLIVKGHRTYRFLTLFSKEHYPSHTRKMPQEISEILKTIGQEKFGEHYDCATGLVKFPESRGQLKAEFGAVGELYARKPDVRFFLEKNPGYLRGDELLCWTELSANNMRSIARKGFELGLSDLAPNKTEKPLLSIL